MLEKINSPKDLKNLSIEELQIVSNEVSELIIDTIEEHGGHYSSPLGVVDLTVALHHCYDSPNDKLVWDVGHQAYAHKILTGRRDNFKTLRQKDGISGFLKRSESVHDAIGAGHSTTSISSALGIAHARDHNNKDFNVVSIIGDGAMTGGMAYEAMNNLGFHRTQQTIILNDNSKSISASVGALSKYLSKIITNPTYNKIRSDIWDISGKIPVVSETIRKFLKKSEEGIKGFLTPGILFEELGIRYIGPIDGHDIDEMVKVFNSVKEIKTPVLLHVFTKKGIKSTKAEKDSIKYYSLSGIKKDNSIGVSYSEIVGKSLIKANPNNNNFKCITAAMDIGTGIKEFCEKYPDKYIDVGIAESHAVSYASGLSTEGVVPVITIYSTFMQRAYDQIMHDILLQGLPAVFCMDRAGLVGPDGPTHHGVFDISMLNSLPNIVISAPKDGNELSNLIYTGILSGKAFAIRYPKGKCASYDMSASQNCIEIGQWEKLVKGSKVALLATGSMVDPCIRIKDKVSQFLGTEVTVVNSRFIKPIDTKMIDNLIKDHQYFFTFEEGSLIGGFGSSVLQYISEKNKTVKVFNKGIKDNFIEHGTRTELLKIAELDDDSLINYIRNNIQ
tara:strand:+ start:31426 stop:33270 length:1845 start_codon:yes stop_codon:yes gene_type:complete